MNTGQDGRGGTNISHWITSEITLEKKLLSILPGLDFTLDGCYQHLWLDLEFLSMVSLPWIITL